MADGTGLENRKGFTLLVGSNPTPSACFLGAVLRKLNFQLGCKHVEI